MTHLPSDGADRKAVIARINQWLLWLGLAAAVVWLVWRHSAHLGEVWPFLLLLACPLMHLLGHGHGSHRRPDARDERGHGHIDDSRSTTG